MLNTDTQIAPSYKETWKPPVEAVATPSPEPSPVSAEPQELTSLLDEALANNPLTQRAWYSAKTAAAQRIQANSPFFPDVTVAQNWQRQRIEAYGFPVGGGTAAGIGDQKISQTRVSYGPMLDISYTLFTFGAQTAQAEAARQALFAANFNYNQQLQDVVLQVQRAYYNLSAAQAAVTAEEASVKDAEASLDAAETKNRVGLSPVQDVLQAKSNLLLEQYRLETSKSLVETARADLGQALGRRDVSSVQIKPPVIKPISPDAVEDVKVLVERAVEKRPDLQAAYANVRAREEQKRASQRNLLPALVGGVSGDITHIEDYPGNEHNYLAYLRLNWDIFDGFNKEARILEASSRLESAKRDAQATELAAIGNVWTQYFTFRTAREQFSSAEALVAAAEAAFDAVDMGYKNGLNSILDLLSAQKDLATARVTLIRAQNNYITSLVSLEHAVGELDLTSFAAASPILKD